MFVLAAILIIFTPALGSAFKGESRSYLGQPAVGWRVGRPPDPDARLNSPFFIRKNERKDGGGAAGRGRIHVAHAYLNYDLAHQP